MRATSLGALILPSATYRIGNDELTVLSDVPEITHRAAHLLADFSAGNSAYRRSWSVTVRRTGTASPRHEPHLIETSSPFGEDPYVSSDVDRHLDVLLRHVNRIKVASEPEHLHFHCGAVARHGQILLVSGESGAGKSTLVASLLRSGWTYLTDDQFAFRPSDGQISPHRRPLALRRAVWPEFKDLAQVPRPQDDDRLRVWLTADELGAAAWPDPADLHVAAIVGVARQPGVRLTIRPAESLAAKWRDLLSQSIDGGRLGVEGIVATIERLGKLPVLDLLYSGLEEVPGTLDDTLDSVGRSAEVEPPLYEPARQPSEPKGKGLTRGADVHSWRFADDSTLLVRRDPFHCIALPADARLLWELLRRPVETDELLAEVPKSTQRRGLRQWLETLQVFGVLTDHV